VEPLQLLDALRELLHGRAPHKPGHLLHGLAPEVKEGLDQVTVDEALRPPAAEDRLAVAERV
jgi:hypothetical protein